MPQSRQKKIYDTVELTLRATLECTRSLHSDTECRPVEVIHASSDEVKMAIKTNFDKAQQTNKCIMRIFGLNTPFFLLDTLRTFDAIIGFESLTRAGVVLDLGNSVTAHAKRLPTELRHQRKIIVGDSLGSRQSSLPWLAFNMP